MKSGVVIDQVLILFVIMAIGYFARKRRIITDEVKKGLTDLILDITLPLMTVASFNQSFSWDKLANVAYIFLFSFVVHGLFFILSKLLYYRCSDDSQVVLRAATAFSNTGFMGFPVLEAVFGKIGIFYASVFNVPFNLILWTFGIASFTKNGIMSNIKNVLFNPTIIATVIGMVTFLTPLKFPFILAKTFDIVGSVTTPLSMMVVGAMLGDINIRELFSGFKVFYYSAIRLIILPLIAFVILRISGTDDVVRGITVVLTAMPTSAVVVILSERYQVEPSLASKCIFMSTLLSVVTIPLVIMTLV